MTLTTATSYSPMKGIIAATLNGYKKSKDGSSVEVDISYVESYAQYLSKNGCSGVFICGTTGDFSLLSLDEKLQLQEAWLQPQVRALFQHVIVHIGSPVFSDMIKLGTHATENGATAVCVTFPAFPGHAPQKEEQLVKYLSEISRQLPKIPLLLYNVEGSTPTAHLRGLFPLLANDIQQKVPTFTGLKFTYPNLIDAVDVKTRLAHLDVAFGSDELMLPALSVGFRSFIGSTFNLFSASCKKLLELYSSGQVDEAQSLYARLFIAIRYLNSKGNFLLNLRVLTNEVATSDTFTLGNFSKGTFITKADWDCSLDTEYFMKTFGDLLNKI